LPTNKTGSNLTSAHPLKEGFSHWPGIDRLRSACLGMILLDMKAVSPIEEDLFTPHEAAKTVKMGPRRRRDFTAARVALKRLTRQLGLVEEGRPDRTIETLGPDGEKPCLAESTLYCSVSHSGRLVVAVAHRYPIGVDLEAISKKAIRVWNLRTLPEERDLISLSGLSPERTATRAWTIKEAAAKALGLHLFEAIREVNVVSIGEEEGVMEYKEKTCPVRHAEGDGYVITLVTCDSL
jgi:phosphopantetheinyl transferase